MEVAILFSQKIYRLTMEPNTQVYFVSNRPQNYVEIQAQVTDTESIENFESLEEPSLLTLFISFLPTFIVLGLLWRFLYRSSKRTDKAINVGDNNTAAIEANNELLRESLQIQKDLLEELRKRPSAS